MACVCCRCYCCCAFAHKLPRLHLTNSRSCSGRLAPSAVSSWPLTARPERIVVSLLSTTTTGMSIDCFSADARGRGGEGGNIATLHATLFMHYGQAHPTQMSDDFVLLLLLPPVQLLVWVSRVCPHHHVCVCLCLLPLSASLPLCCTGTTPSARCERWMVMATTTSSCTWSGQHLAQSAAEHVCVQQATSVLHCVGA